MLTAAAPPFKPELRVASSPGEAENYGRLLRSLHAHRGAFAFFPLLSNYPDELRDRLLERLEDDLFAAGLRLHRIRLTTEDWDPLEHLPPLDDDTTNRVYLLLGWETTPGLLSIWTHLDESPPALRQMNVAREAVRARFRCPVVAWCTPNVYGQFRRHAPDMFDHYAGLPELLLPFPLPTDGDDPMAEATRANGVRIEFEAVPRDALILLAERAVTDGWSEERLRQAARALTAGVHGEEGKSGLEQAAREALSHLGSSDTAYIRVVAIILNAQLEIRKDSFIREALHHAMIRMLRGRQDHQSLHEVIRHARELVKLGGRDGSGVTYGQLTEAGARCELAELGETPVEHLEAAAALFSGARLHLERDDARCSATLVGEGNTRVGLADLGRDPHANLELALRLYSEAETRVPTGNPDLGRVHLNAAAARMSLAALGREPEANLELALHLCRKAETCFPAGSPELGRALGKAASAQMRLAALGREPEANLELALHLYRKADTYFPAESPDRGWVHLNTAAARTSLAALGRDPEANLELALHLSQEARSWFPAGSPDLGRALGSAATGLMGLAALGREPEANLELALRLCERALSCFPVGSPDQGRTRLSAATARTSLAELGRDSLQNLEQALDLLNMAVGSFSPGSPDHGRALLQLASVHVLLAASGEHPLECFALAARCLDEAVTMFDPGTVEWSAALRVRTKALLAWAEVLEGAGAPAEAAARRERVAAHLQQGIETLEQLPREPPCQPEPQATLKTRAVLYGAWVDLLLNNAEGVADPAEARRQRLEAWHAVHRAQRPTFLDRVALGGRELAGQDQWLWDKLDRSCELLDSRERAEAVRRQQSNPPPGRPDLVEEAHQTYRRNRSELLLGMDMARVRNAPEPPQPAAIVAAVRRLAGADRRTLLVEYFPVAEGQFAAFLCPTWREPTEVAAVRIALKNTSGGVAPGSRGEAPQNGKLRSAGESRLAAATLPWVEFVLSQGWEPTEVVISPHDVIAGLPLHAAEHEGTPLLERWPISYLPSPTLAPALSPREITDISPRPALVIGAAEEQKLPGAWGSPSAREGAEQLFACLRSLGHPAIRLLGPDATVREITNAIRQRPGLVHLIGVASVVPHEILRSGIEMAERRLTVLDVVTRFELRGTDLVFLSLREKRAVGDDDSSLERAFLLAGAGSVLSSLGPVQDTAARFFQQEFYQAWLREHVPLTEAFRRAVLSTRQAFPDPAAWAPFVLLGAWATPAPLPAPQSPTE